MGVKKFNFCQFFLLGFVLKFLFALDVGPLWHSKHVFRQVFHMFVHCSSHVYSVCILSV